MQLKRCAKSLFWIGGLALVGIAGCGGSGDDLGNSGGLPNGSASQTQIKRGRYLVTAVGACADCHNGLGGNNPSDPNWLSGYHDGTPGQPFQVGPFKTYPANLTPDPDTGLGKWTPQQIFSAMRDGKDDEGKYLCPPMPWPVLSNMTDDDLWSVVAYLRSIKPVKNAVPESEGPGAAPGQHGDWSSSYTNLPPLPPYPGTNETGGTP